MVLHKMFPMNNPGERKNRHGSTLMSLSHACVRGHSRAQIAILLLFITIQSWPGRGICVAKIRALNERFPGLKNTAPEFVPLNSFSCLCAPGSSLFTEHRNGSDKRLWMHFWNEVSTAGFPLVWQRLTAQLLHVKTTQEVPCREGQLRLCM